VLVGAVAVLAVGLWWTLRPSAGSGPNASVTGQPASTAVPALDMVNVPDLLNRDTAVAAEIANSLRLRLAATDEQGQALDPLTAGLVLTQSPVAGTRVSEGAVIQLEVATRTATVPSVGGMSLGDALARLRAAGLDLGTVETVVGSGARAGTVVRQTPQAGTTVRQGSRIGVGVADQARAAQPASKLQAKSDATAATGSDPEASKK
jgi:serine/threonine-protein kinase